ncbi:MAG: transposase [Microcoleus sp. PH2017_01_SCD_O_A]|nr:transposase [Microcoleus sp. PH2017_01_SCD_O_A]MCC3452973.1 transposase [Microcoleus sp. PH2017_08_TRC_O_A]MCC3497883.1 transposase [Microcoleus sp. PH2017_15_JOR_U_A]MCC3596613.1 transposase [Microcoleus sp. PH2017_26_ELK_O_A]
MKARSKASKTKQDKDSTMLSHTSAVQLSWELFANVASVQPNSETTLLGKLNLCENDIQKLKSSKASALDSTLREKDCKPYWSELCAQISSRLLLPVETSKADSDLSYSSLWSSKTVENSWFSQTLFTALKPNSQPIFLPSFTATVAECTASGATARKSRKIRIFPSPEQKALLKRWFGVSRFVFNATIKYLQEPGTKANWLTIKTGILNSLPDWASSVPFQIKSIAIKDACQAVKKAKADFKKDGQVRRCKFRSRKDTKQSIYIPKSAIKDCGIYHTILGRSKLKEALPKDFSDGRLMLAYGEYYLIVSEEVQPRQTDNQGRVVALDPGVRTFMTFISESSYGYLGNDSNLQIQKLCFKLDRLISKMSASPSAQKKRFKKAADRLKSKVQHMVKELHDKTAKFLVDNFDVILLPSFESSKMVSKSRRKIRSKTVRQMLTLSHYQFKKHLEWKAWESGKVALTDINEAYTSKTVSWTGEVKKIGGSRVIRDRDGRCMNRDLNGARGIFLRASVDTPWLREHLSLCIC